jgi:hypothetical protein
VARLASSSDAAGRFEDEDEDDRRPDLSKAFQLPAAGRAKSRVRWAERFATGTLKMRTLVSAPDDQVSDIRDPGEGIREDEN